MFTYTCDCGWVRNILWNSYDLFLFIFTSYEPQPPQKKEREQQSQCEEAATSAGGPEELSSGPEVHQRELEHRKTPAMTTDGTQNKSYCIWPMALK